MAQFGYRGVTLSLLLHVKMLVTLPEKHWSPNTWQRPYVLDWNALSACDVVTKNTASDLNAKLKQ
jgi:hypothetical protein